MSLARPLKILSGMGSSRMVLVLEDDHNLQESVRRVAERLGYRVVSARSLSEAKGLLARIAKPCLVLLDTLMKEGLEAMAQLGAQYPLATIPVPTPSETVRAIRSWFLPAPVSVLNPAFRTFAAPVVCGRVIGR